MEIFRNPPPKDLDIRDLATANRRIKQLEGWVGAMLVDQGKIKRKVYFALLLTSIPIAGRLFHLAGRRTLRWYEENVSKSG